MDDKFDKETAQIIRNEKNIADLCRHEAWPLLKQKFIEKIMELQSVRNIRVDLPEKMAIEMQGRLFAIDVLMEWMNDIEGTALNSNTVSNEIKRDSYIITKRPE